MRVWAVTFTELAEAESVAYEPSPDGPGVQFLVFAESAYAQAVEAFNRLRDDRLSFHSVRNVGQYGPDAHAHLRAHDGDDQVDLRPYEVIGS